MKLKYILGICQVFSQRNGNAVMLRQLGGFGQEFKSAFSLCISDPDQNGEVQGLTKAMEMLALT